MVWWIRRHCPPDTGFEIPAQAVWGRARYLSVTGAPHNSASLRVSGEETFCFFEISRPEWGSNLRSSTFEWRYSSDHYDVKLYLLNIWTTMTHRLPLVLILHRLHTCSCAIHDFLLVARPIIMLAKYYLQFSDNDVLFDNIYQCSLNNWRNMLYV